MAESNKIESAFVRTVLTVEQLKSEDRDTGVPVYEPVGSKTIDGFEIVSPKSSIDDMSQRQVSELNTFFPENPKLVLISSVHQICTKTPKQTNSLYASLNFSDTYDVSCRAFMSGTVQLPTAEKLAAEVKVSAEILALIGPQETEDKNTVKSSNATKSWPQIQQWDLVHKPKY